MCIICNCGKSGEKFLLAFESTREYMAQAKEAMLSCSQVAANADIKKHYDATHKKMVRLIKEWNKLEEFREGVMWTI